MPLPKAQVVIARGPFTVEGDRALLQAYGITHVVAKNSGGMGAAAKLEAARELGLPVILINRPKIAQRHTAVTVAQVMEWLSGSHADPSDAATTDRGV